MKTIEKLVIVIIALAILGILFLFISDIRDFSSEKTRFEKCKGAVKAQVYSTETPVKTNPETIDCPAKDITIEREKQIYDEMIECWKIYNQGELFDGNGKFCGVCSYINVDEDFSFNLKSMETSYYDERTYADYLGADVENSEIEISSIENYAVVFIQNKNDEKTNDFVFSFIFSPAIGFLVSKVYPPDITVFSQVLLMPYTEEKVEGCDYLVR